MYYTATDHLGNINMLVTQNRTVAQHNSVDAWGRRRNTTDWTYTNVEVGNLTDRCYTGHEHLDDFGLINMNARLYDPYIGRMLSADNVLQDPTASQNYNKYSYVVNNPLKYTDPTGNKIVGGTRTLPVDKSNAAFYDNFFNFIEQVKSAVDEEKIIIELIFATMTNGGSIAETDLGDGGAEERAVVGYNVYDKFGVATFDLRNEMLNNEGEQKWRSHKLRTLKCRK